MYWLGMCALQLINPNTLPGVVQFYLDRKSCHKIGDADAVADADADENSWCVLLLSLARICVHCRTVSVVLFFLACHQRC